MSREAGAVIARVKVCGLTRPDDARAAADLGAWACGMILSPRGPRALDLARALTVRHAIPPGVLAVGVVVDEPAERVNALARELALDLVQLHGSEPPALLADLCVPALKVMPVDAAASSLPPVEGFEAAWGLLFDTRSGSAWGGTGRVFPWAVLAKHRPPGRVLLAGGIGPDNVASALAAVRPFAVDVSSGVESAPGIKEREKLERLFAAAGVS